MVGRLKKILTINKASHSDKCYERMKLEKVTGSWRGREGAFLERRANWTPTLEGSVPREESKAFSLQAGMPKAMDLGLAGEVYSCFLYPQPSNCLYPTAHP